MSLVALWALVVVVLVVVVTRVEVVVQSPAPSQARHSLPAVQAEVVVQAPVLLEGVD
jgi:hypothetical protein